MTRFPLEPLAIAAGITFGQLGGHQPDDHPSGNARLAELVGVSARTARRLRHTGLSEIQADRAATALGLHPIVVWPAEWAESVLYADLPPAGAANARKVHCPQGHPYSGTDSRGRRVCRWCSRENLRTFRQKRANAQRVQVISQPGLWEAS